MSTMEREEKERHGLRILFMILFWFILRLSYFITGLLALVQWIWRWFEERPEGRLRRFSVSLARFQRQVVDFLLFNTSRKPFPFDDWPSGDAADIRLEDEGSMEGGEPTSTESSGADNPDDKPKD